MMLPMKTLQVGCAVQTGPRRKYWKDFDALEVDARIVSTIKSSTAARWRAEAPAHATFVPVTPPALAAGRFTGPALDAWTRTLAVAEALGAGTVLLHTPSAFRPTADNAARLAAFVAEHRPEGIDIAWWAEGLWEGVPDMRAALCAKAGLIAAVDPLGHDEDDDEPLPEGARIYWRLMGRKGLSSRYTDFEIDTLLALADERESGHIVFTAPTMHGDAKRFSRTLRMMRGDEGGAFDEDGDRDDDDDEVGADDEAVDGR